MDVTWDDEDPVQCEKVRALNLTNEYATYVDLDRRPTMELDLEKLKTDIEAVFEPQLRSAYTDLEVEVRQYNDEVHIEVSQMYEHLPLTFDTLMKLPELLGTKEFSVNQWSHGGCESCDYGSKFAHEFTVKVSCVKAAQAAK
jgi:hypothetical protein